MIQIFQGETNVSLMWHLIDTGHENLWLHMGYPWTQIFVIEGVGCGLGRGGAATEQQMRLEKVKTCSIWNILFVTLGLSTP